MRIVVSLEQTDVSEVRTASIIRATMNYILFRVKDAKYTDLSANIDLVLPQNRI
jgi:hypothetical protein